MLHGLLTPCFICEKETDKINASEGQESCGKCLKFPPEVDSSSSLTPQQSSCE